MKTGLLLISLAAFSWSQTEQRQTEQRQTEQNRTERPVVGKPALPKLPEFKRLVSVTWDLSTHKLLWVVERGVIVNGEFVAGSTRNYAVSPDEAFMEAEAKDEQRELDQDEAASLHELLNILSLYCVQSVEWWEHGASPSPKTPNATPQKPTRVDPQQPQAEPAHPAPPTLVAAKGAH